MARKTTGEWGDFARQATAQTTKDTTIRYYWRCCIIIVVVVVVVVVDIAIDNDENTHTND